MGAHKRAKRAPRVQRQVEPAPQTGVVDSSVPSWIAGALVLCFVLQCAASMLQQSATFDEPVYIAAGYSYVHTGDFRLKQDAPPLVSTLSGLAVALGTQFGNEVQFDSASPLWSGQTEYRFASEFFARAQNRYRTLQIARIPVVLIGALLAVYLFLFGRLLLGAYGALGPLFLLCFDPNLIAHARVVSDDAALAAFFLISHYYFYRLLTEEARANVIGVSAAVALTTAAKFSGLLVFPSLLLLGGLFYFLPTLIPLVPNGTHTGTVLEQRRRLLRIAALTAAACLGTTVLLVTLLYQSPAGVARYVAGVQSLYTNGTPDYKYYMLGNFRSNSSWYYYPVAMLLKTPEVTLALLALTAVYAFVRGSRAARSAWLLVPVAVVLVVCSQDPVNLGLRRVLLVFPFLFLWIGEGSVGLWEITMRFLAGRRAGQLAWAGLALVAAAVIYSAVRIHPYQLAYFNSWVGGPGSGSRYLDDSNIDWGQDLPGLAAWQSEHGPRPLALWYFGTDDPASYGIESRPISNEELLQPQKTAYAISVTSLVGLKLQAQETGRPDLDWLMRYAPVATVGYSIYIYDFR